MFNRRSKFEISIQILEEIQGGCTRPTRIMFRTNLSWISLRRTLNALSQKRLIESHYSDGDKRSKKVYRITEKGAEVLRYFNKSIGLLDTRDQLLTVG
jgi:predicted transcriptional regulator